MTDNPKYDKFTVERVKNDADIRDFIPGCTRKPEQMVECPFCHSKKLSVVHKGGKNFAYCFSCKEVSSKCSYNHNTPGPPQRGKCQVDPN